MRNFKVVWRDSNGRVRSSAVSYSATAAETRKQQLESDKAVARVIEVAPGADVPADVLEEMRAGLPSAACP
ncbi:hypothetical protein [Streptomyces melanogenes]|uniref:DUF1508 domain-containing protein n=1 Tax=Streptomyces melanogenes TaxID=67326 RepID=A0ABZ1XVE8_9ACTN|nr:hypothetical protein [Streptomyces melanogenes]